MRIAILGAGMSGLACGFYIKKLFPQAELKIFEKNTRVGGIIETSSHNGHLFELGARGLRPAGKGHFALEFIREVGLWDEMILAQQKAKKRYIYLNGKLRRVPTNPLQVLFSPLRKGLFESILNDLSLKPSGGLEEEREETVSTFSLRHFATDFKENIVDALISGICGGDCERLSLPALFPALAKMEQRHGSLIKAWFKRPESSRNGIASEQSRAGIISFRKGMSQLTAQIALHLVDHLKLGCEITHIESAPQVLRMEGSNGLTYEADRVISTLPAYLLANILHGFDPKLSTVLKEIEYAPVAVVPLLFPKQVNPYKGFGYLIPWKEQQEILGAYWNDQTFPQLHPGKGSSFTILMGGSRFKDFHSRDENYFIQTALANLRRHLKIKAEPEFVSSKILPKAIPQYSLGHLKRVSLLQQYSPRHFHIRGNFIGGVGISDIIRNAKDTAQKVAATFWLL